MQFESDAGKDARCLNTAAGMWIQSVQFIFGPLAIDNTRAAKLGLKDSLREIGATEEELKAELDALIARIRATQKQTKSIERLKPMLVQSKKIKGRLAVLLRKREALDNHMETLENSELNQHVLASMQKTSHALKGMGLDKSLESVDRVMLDLEENHNDIRDIQHTLGTSFDQSEDVDFDLELCLLLDLPAPDRPPAVLRAPVSVNNIDDPTAPPTLAESAALEPAAASATAAARRRGAGKGSESRL
jgi:hypothetical protein